MKQTTGQKEARGIDKYRRMNEEGNKKQEEKTVKERSGKIEMEISGEKIEDKSIEMYSICRKLKIYKSTQMYRK